MPRPSWAVMREARATTRRMRTETRTCARELASPFPPESAIAEDFFHGRNFCAVTWVGPGPSASEARCGLAVAAVKARSIRTHHRVVIRRGSLEFATRVPASHAAPAMQERSPAGCLVQSALPEHLRRGRKR